MRALLLLLLVTIAAPAAAQQRLRGTVTDTLGRPVPFATIADTKGRAIAQADSTGRFSFTLQRRPAGLQVSAVSYHKTHIALRTGADDELNVQLRPNNELQEVLVSTVSCQRRSCGFGCGGVRIRRRTLQGSAKQAAPVAPSVYPNPSTGTVTLQAPARITTLYLTDMSGRAVQQLQGTDRRVRLELGHFAAGTYLLRYQVEGSGWRTEKIVLLR